MSTAITHMIEAVAVQVIEVNRVPLQPGRALLIAARMGPKPFWAVRSTLKVLAEQGRTHLEVSFPKQ